LSPFARWHVGSGAVRTIGTTRPEVICHPAGCPMRPLSTHPSARRLAFRLGGFVRARLWLQVLVAIALGIATGLAIGPAGGWLAPETALVVGSWLALPGTLFLALVQMIVIPLVVASIRPGHGEQ
jgi:hypothetical protein